MSICPGAPDPVRQRPACTVLAVQLQAHEISHDWGLGMQTRVLHCAAVSPHSAPLDGIWGRNQEQGEREVTMCTRGGNWPVQRADTTRWHNDGWRLGQRRERYANSKPSLHSMSRVWWAAKIYWLNDGPACDDFGPTLCRRLASPKIQKREAHRFTHKP